MGLSDDTEENSEARFEDLCLDLNLDKKAKEEAWQAFEAMRTNYTLEVCLCYEGGHDNTFCGRIFH